jgi:hypothetical protein
MRRPAGQPDDLEGRANPAVAVGKALRIDLGHAGQGRAPQRRATALAQRIRRAHAAQFAHQDDG